MNPNIVLALYLVLVGITGLVSNVQIPGWVTAVLALLSGLAVGVDNLRKK